MKKNKYLIIAALTSPFLGVFVVTYFELLLSSLLQGARVEAIEFLVSSAATALVGGAIVGLPWTILFGLPMYYLLNRINLSTSWMYGLMGYLAGTIAHLAFFYDTGSTLGIQMKGIVMFGIYGLSVSLVFWFFSINLRNRTA